MHRAIDSRLSLLMHMGYLVRLRTRERGSRRIDREPERAALIVLLNCKLHAGKWNESLGASGMGYRHEQKTHMYRVGGWCIRIGPCPV